MLMVLLAMVACLIISPFVLAFGPILIHSPPIQYTLDSFRHRNHIPVHIPKTSQLIGFVCGAADSYNPTNSLYVMRPDGARLHDISIDKTRVHHGLDWWFDGEWLALALGYRNLAAAMDEWHPHSLSDEIYRIRYDGTEVRRLTYSDSYKNNPRWTRDGRDILYRDASFRSPLLRRVSRWSTNTETLTTLEIAGYDLSPDRKKLAVFARNRDGGPTPVYQLNPDGTELEYLMTPSIDISDIQWSPDKQRLLYYAGWSRLYIYNLEAGAEETLPPIRVRSAQWSSDGRWIAIIGGLDRYRENDEWTLIQGTMADEPSNKLYLLDIESGRLKPLLDAPDFFASGLSWSPDSQWLAFSHGSPNSQIHKIRADGSGLRRLTDMDCDAYGAAWSPK